MTMDELTALGLRVQNAGVWAIMMHATVRAAVVYETGRFLHWECSCRGPSGVSITVRSDARDSAGWCEVIENCHDRWVAALRSAPS